MFDLKNATVLTRNEMKKVKGKGGGCIMKVTPSGGGEATVIRQYFSGEGHEISEGANNECVRLISEGYAARCRYDCYYDGIGQ